MKASSTPAAGPQDPPAGPARRGGRDSVERAVERLRLMVVTGDLPPGTQLSQVELARRIGMSTTPVREALRQLEVEGLVETRRNMRPRVPPFDPHDLDGVYANRILLEVLGLALTVPGLREEGIEALHADLEAMRTAGERQQLEVWEHVHATFHLRLVAGCERTLQTQIRVMMARSDRYRRMSVLGDQPHAWGIGRREHEAIVAACADRDTTEAQRQLARHLARSAESVLRHLGPGSGTRAVTEALAIVEAGRV